MNRKKWICTAAAITGLLLAVIAGLSIRHMKNSSYVSASELAGQKSGSVSEKLEENGNEDLAESSESTDSQSSGASDGQAALNGEAGDRNGQAATDGEADDRNGEAGAPAADNSAASQEG